MNKEEYISRLYEYTEKRGIRIYDYYKSLAIHCRNYKHFEIIGFESFNPFLTPEDYKKLLESSDELMPEFFARAMVKVIAINDIIIEEEKKAREAQVEKEKLNKMFNDSLKNGKTNTLTPSLSYDTIKGIIDEEYRKAEERDNQSKALMVIEPKTTALVPVVQKKAEPKKETLPRKVIKKIIEDRFYRDDRREPKLPQEVIEQYTRPENKNTALVPVTATESAKTEEEAKKDEYSSEDIQKIFENGLYPSDRREPRLPQEVIEQYTRPENSQTALVPVSTEDEVKHEEPVRDEKPKTPKKSTKKSSVFDRIMNKNGAKGKVASVLEKLTRGTDQQEETSEQKVEVKPTVEAGRIAPQTHTEMLALPPRPEYKALMPASQITRSEIEESITEAITNIKAEEQHKKKSLFGFLSLNVDLIRKLKGFALLRESKTGQANLYYHDPATNILKGKLNADNISADTGYYVNYQEYIYKMINNTMKRYPENARIILVNEQGEEKAITEVVEEVFRTLREAGAIRFGNDYATARINSFADLKGIKHGYGSIADEKLKMGIYVRRDILKEEFKKYKIRITLKEMQDEEEQEENTTYQKTK